MWRPLTSQKALLLFECLDREKWSEDSGDGTALMRLSSASHWPSVVYCSVTHKASERVRAQGLTATRKLALAQTLRGFFHV